MANQSANITEKEIEELIKKADSGDDHAKYNALKAMIIGDYVKTTSREDFKEKYLEYLEELSDRGKTYAYIMLAEVYEKGELLEKDIRKAIALYRKAAEAGEPFGYESLGRLYYEGKEVPSDYKLAFEYMTKADGEKAFCTLYMLAEMYRKGMYVEQDMTQAVKYYSEIAESNESYNELDDYYKFACFRYAEALHRGYGCKKNLRKARNFADKAYDCFEQSDIEEKYGVSCDMVLAELMDIEEDLYDARICKIGVSVIAALGVICLLGLGYEIGKTTLKRNE